MKKLFIFLCFTLLFCGCAEEQSTEIAGEVTVLIETLDETVLNETIKFPNDSSAYDVTLQAAEKKGVEIVFEGTEKTAFLTKAQGLANGDFGDMSGWLYEVNGEAAMVGCGQYAVQDKDIIRWYYVEDFMAIQ